MARTISEIEAGIEAAIAASPILSVELTSVSKTAFFRLLISIFAQAVRATELAYDTFAADLEERLLNQRVGSTPWYSDESKLFQYGDTLIYEGDGKFGYATVDEDLQIIDRVAIVVASQQVIIKVAKEVSGVVGPLSAAEKTAFEDYWTTKDFVPSFVSVISDAGDDVRLTFTATLDPQIFNTTTGERLSDNTQAVEVAIQEFFDDFTDVDFNGEFRVNDLIAEIITLNGVDNFTLSVAEAKADSEAVYTDILAATGKKYNTFAGYFKDAIQTPNYQ